MTRFVLASLAMLSGGVLAQAQQVQPAAPAAKQPATGAINELCPVGKEPIDGKTFIQYEGRTIGFCCPGCDETFLEWSKQRRDTFVKRNLDAPAAQPETTPGKKPEKAAAAGKRPMTALYPLANCPISGKALGSMGEPIIKTYDGREVRFCCASCVPSFEKDTQAQLKKIDAHIVRMQLPFYPVETCVVSGEKLGSMGAPDDYIHQNRLVRLCCESCRATFDKNPESYIAKLDKAAAEEQRGSYPLTTCMVRGSTLGSMGEPAEVVLAGRLVRMCCAPCEKDLRAEPAKYITQLDEAWRKAGRPNVPGSAPTGR